MLPSVALADDYKDRLKAVSYLELIKIDPTTLDRKQRKSYDDVRRKRDQQVQKSYEGTRLVRDDFKASTMLVSPYGFATTSTLCMQESNCFVIIDKDFDNACGSYNNWQFCDFSSAYARGGTKLDLTRINFDVKTTPRTERVNRPRSCANCPDMSYNKVTYSTRYSENYRIVVPLTVLRGSALNGSLAIQLSGSSGNRVVAVDQEVLIGFLRKFDETKAQFLR